MWWRRSWFSLKGKAGIPGQTEGRPATSIGPRVPPVGSLQQRDFGVKVDPDDVRRQMGKGGDQLMPSFLAPDLIEQKGPEIERFRVDLFKRKYLPRARAFPGVRELFERLRAEGQSVVLASSAKAGELEHYKSLAGITDLIYAATSSDDVERSKPYPDIFRAALEHIRPIRPEE